MDILIDAFPYLAKAAFQTVWLSVATILLATAVGSVLGVMSVLYKHVFGPLISVYVFLIRGVPILVLIFVAYFSFPTFGLYLNDYVAVLLVLVFYGAALISEIVRGAILAVPYAQTQSAQGLGLRRWQIMTYVLLPQALRSCIPPLLNNYVHLVKCTSFVSVVGVWELTLAAREVTERTGAPFTILLTVMLFYYAICYPMAKVGRRLERNLGSSEEAL
ncbi:ABC transporter permease subunit [Sneathiella chungangensis]|uniref:ABC transporter permease subunit n=1 Tax=Sneathiella chungangensis TaxID=1418234 RepID=A0A845MSC6_9PROT|nr:amino acid ABC transporter permease [Sneathiella chungangensis]MZR24344.1 ABC transporter permease subunit [Sneathiella chungangensis]